MYRIALAAAALMSSTAVLAQTTDNSATMNADGATSAAQPVTQSSPATTAAPATPAMSAPAAPAATASASTSASTTATADTGSMGAHDMNRDGGLSPLEFAHHATAANGAMTAEAKRERYSRASGNGAIKLLNATAADFSKADKNMDKRVDASELAMWQSGGMSASATGAAASTPITSGAGSMSPAPSTSDTGATPAAPATGSNAGTSGSTTSTDTPGDDMTDDMQNSTDPNESTTTPPTS